MALIERCRGNDPTAFGDLVGRYHAFVFAVCMRFLRHRQDAEDVTQETFSRVARHLDRWDSQRPFEPWLAAIAGNRCRTFLAKRQRCRPLSTAAEPMTDAVAQRSAAECLREELSLAMRALPATQRQAFELFHQQSLSYQQIAVRMNRPVGTIKTWVHRARTSVIATLRDREVIAGRLVSSVGGEGR
ncbi:MAG: sigma-70 family RNA polymerase sigma factor [Planctomycetota bacterium]